MLAMNLYIEKDCNSKGTRSGALVYDCVQPFWPLSKQAVLTIVVGILFLILLPYAQLGVLYSLPFWAQDKPEVHKNSCTCQCWDTLFKGIYEKPPAHYKHVYFNLTGNTLKIWINTVLAAVALYETVRHLVNLLYNSRARLSMVVLFLASLYPHYYTWWANFNMWNDSFYKQWKHQALFSVTELFSTVYVVHLIDKTNALTSNKLLVIITIAVFHISASGLDQFVNNVIFRKGKIHQVVRDVALMFPDGMHIIIPACLFKKCNNNSVGFCKCNISLKQFLVASFSVFFLLFVTARL